MILATAEFLPTSLWELSYGGFRRGQERPQPCLVISGVSVLPPVTSPETGCPHTRTHTHPHTAVAWLASGKPHFSLEGCFSANHLCGHCELDMFENILPRTKIFSL